jgi:hypothetical protein
MTNWSFIYNGDKLLKDLSDSTKQVLEDKITQMIADGSGWLQLGFDDPDETPSVELLVTTGVPMYFLPDKPAPQPRIARTL